MLATANLASPDPERGVRSLSKESPTIRSPNSIRILPVQYAPVYVPRDFVALPVLTALKVDLGGLRALVELWMSAVFLFALDLTSESKEIITYLAEAMSPK
jgi:hypothetical protein